MSMQDPGAAAAIGQLLERVDRLERRIDALLAIVQALVNVNGSPPAHDGDVR